MLELEKNKKKLGKISLLFFGTILIASFFVFGAYSFTTKTYSADETTSYVWVTNTGDNTVTKLDLSGNIIGTYPVGKYPIGIAIDPSGNVWVTNNSDNTVTKLHPDGTPYSGSPYPAGNRPKGITVDSSKNVWIGNSTAHSIDGTVTKLSPSGNIYTSKTYPLKNSPEEIAVDASGNVWVGIYNGDTGYNAVIELSPSGDNVGTYIAGNDQKKYPGGIAFDASGNVWVTNPGSQNPDGIGNIVTKLNGSTGAVIKTYPAGTVPYGIAFDSSGNVWVTNIYSSTVTKLSSLGNTIGTYSVGNSPWSIAIDPSGNVWVGNKGDSTVTKLSPLGNTLGTYSVGNSPSGIAIGGSSTPIIPPIEPPGNSTHNVYGWGWTSNIGWISFNNHGLAGITGGGGNVDYGVNIEPTGNLSGYAWSENVGWINFRPTIDSYSPTFPDGTTTNYAKVSLTGKHLVSGWARACSVFAQGCSGALNPNRGGWDGWIKLQENVYVNTTPIPAEFRNWFWAGNPDGDANKSVIGWGTFNCLEGGVNGDPVCSNSNFKVATTFFQNETTCHNSNGNFTCSADSCGGAPCDITKNGTDCASYPIGCDSCGNNTCVPGGSIPSGTGTCNCGPKVYKVDKNNPLNDPLNDPPITENEFKDDRCNNSLNFNWTYFSASGIAEKSWQLQVATDSKFSNIIYPTDLTKKTKNDSLFVNNKTNNSLSLSLLDASSPFNFGQTYYWRVQAIDDQNNSSGWVTAGPENSPTPFTTQTHRAPYTAFTLSPTTLSPVTLKNGKAEFSFVDASICYDLDNNKKDTCTTWNWTFGDGKTCKSALDKNCQGNVSNTYNKTNIAAGLHNGYPVELTVCDGDADNYCCSAPMNVMVKSPLDVPQWQEISPFK